MIMGRAVVFLSTVMLRFADAAEYTLAPTWAEPSRVNFCPVHAPFTVRAVGTSVEFVPPNRGAFSLAEASVAFPAGTAGLRLRLSASGSTMPSFWRVALHRLGGDHAKSKIRFVAPVEVPSGGVERTVFIPWASFLGQKMRVGGMNECSSGDPSCLFQPEEITHASVLWSRKSGIEEPSLMLHEVVVTSSTEVSVPVPASTACSCDVDCVRCEVVKWAPLVSKACSSSTTADMCLAVRRSLAERVAAGLGGAGDSCAAPGAAVAVQWLGSTMDVTHCMAGTPPLAASVLGDILEGVFEVLPEASAPCEAGTDAHTSQSQGFAGPFVGWGITGHNDLASFESQTVDSCLEKCLAEPRCRSIDYGARDHAQGQCWLSTKDRLSAASAYSGTKWYLYDYYERSTTATSTDNAVVNAGSMAQALSAERRTELLGSLDMSGCCTDPDSCMTKAIEAGVPIYNSGDALGCFVIYHAVAARFAECEAQSSGLPSARGLMQAAATTSEMDATPSHAAWRLRRAFDAYSLMLRFSDPASMQCKNRSIATLNTVWTSEVISVNNPGSNTSSNAVGNSEVGTSGSALGTSGSAGGNSGTKAPSEDQARTFGGTSASGALSSVGESLLLAMALPLSILMFSNSFH